jgi:general secretion pathway protein E/type IV pilus assembly protein PilB
MASQQYEHFLAEISTESLQIVTTEQAWHYRIIPFKKGNGIVRFMIDNAEDADTTMLELEVLFGQEIVLETVESDFIQQQLSQFYRKTRTASKGVSNISSNLSNNDQEILSALIEEAKELGSSDIHLEPYEMQCRVRLRIDGVLIERYKLDKSSYPSLVNKIKIRANLDISEKRLPQDGRIFFENQQGKKIDIRVSILPTLHGEKVVLRLLSNDATDIDLEKLGLNKKDLKEYLESVRQPSGIVLISGPTGSGKTTTLYATLKLLNQSTRNIITIEDPIEYTLEGINQVQLRENIGFDFASALRTFLRQDPDVIMVGEIRDKATASMAIRASLTGHLVMSTIHTNSAWGIISRLADMGVPSYLLADTLNAAVAQRLVRLLCSDCKTKHEVDFSKFPHKFKMPYSITEVYQANGCERCFYTGYRGRSAVYEIIPIDNELQQKIKNNEFNVETLLKARNIKSLSENAFDLLAAGKTSVDEVYPILGS